jgi:hypothetical protein
MCVIRQGQEHYLCDPGEGDNGPPYPELVMLASHLMRFGVGDDAS